MDVVRRYDIDGVHFDDYFYPYPEKADGKDVPFPDDVPWRRYQQQGGRLVQADWRRENVNRFVRTVYDGIKKEKPWVKFGISPFGIWRPGHPAQITGFDAYGQLYGDAQKWMSEGWLDYCAPQLYWPVDKKEQSFPVLLQWWIAQNTRHRMLLAGMEVGGWKNVANDAKEVAREIESVRQQPGASGEILWHAKPLMREKSGVVDVLQNQMYSAPALVPASPWLGAAAPGQPVLQAVLDRGELKLNWKSSGGAISRWVLQKKAGGHWTTEILGGNKTSEAIKANSGQSLPESVALHAIDRLGNMSSGAMYHKVP